MDEKEGPTGPLVELLDAWMVEVISATIETIFARAVITGLSMEDFITNLTYVMSVHADGMAPLAQHVAIQQLHYDKPYRITVKLVTSQGFHHTIDIRFDDVPPSNITINDWTEDLPDEDDEPIL